MYRELIETQDQIDSLLGQLVRLEWGSPPNIPIVGVVEKHPVHGYIAARGTRGAFLELRVIGGWWAIFATTGDEIRSDEPPLPGVLWGARGEYRQS